MESVYAQIDLRNLRCHKQDDHGNSNDPSEPYMWVVFFKIDGDTVVFNPDSRVLEGTATVLPVPGNQGDLPTTGMKAGDSVAIPSALGQLCTVIKPIPFTKAFGGQIDQAGTLGCIAVLLEEDDTRALDVHYGHEALNRRFAELMNAFVPTLGLDNPSVTPGDIAAMRGDLENAVHNAIAARWGILDIGRDWDDSIGSAVIYYSQTTLTDGGTVDFSEFIKKGDSEEWELTGQVSGVRVSSLVVPAFEEAIGRLPTDEELAAWSTTLRFYGTPRSQAYAGIVNHLVVWTGTMDGEAERRAMISRSYLDIFGRAPFDQEVTAWFDSIQQRPIPYRVLVNEHLDWLIARVDPLEIERVVERSFLVVRNRAPTRVEIDTWVDRIVVERLGYRQIVGLL
jgi:hypothetical protein